MTSSKVAKGTDRLFDLFLFFFPSPFSSPGNHTALVDFTGLGTNLFYSAAEPGGVEKSLSIREENSLYSPKKNVSSSLVWSALLAKEGLPPQELSNLPQIFKIFLPRK